MEERRKRTLIIVAVLLVLIALVLLFFLLFGRKPASPSPLPEVQPPPTTGGLESAPSKTVETAVPENPVALPLPPAPKQPNAVRVAEVFAQRYASYSNQEQPYQNLIDLMPVMTASYRAATEAKVAKAAAGISVAYQGTTSAKVSSTVVSSDATAATIDVLLQQAASSASGTDVTYHTLRANLEKNGDAWEVDGVSWQN